MAISNLATGRLADDLGAGTMLALPGLAFVAVTVLTLCASTLREIYGGRLPGTAVSHGRPLYSTPHATNPPLTTSSGFTPKNSGRHRGPL
jgi:hypothetical protein